MKTAIPWHRSSFFLLAGTLSLVFAADFLLYKHPPGWNLGLWEIALLLVVVLTHRSVLRMRAGQLILAAMIGLSAALMAQPGPLVVLLTGLGTVTLALMARSGWIPQTGEWFRRWVLYGFTLWFQILEDFLLYQRWRHQGHGSPIFARALALAKNWLLPIVLSGGFLILFAIANPVISKLLENIDQSLTALFERFDVDMFRLVFWASFATGSWALLRKRIPRSRRTAAPLRVERPGAPGRVVRCLALFNLLFALQNVLDIRYLYGGAILPQGMTYAQYAHRGAYPLIFTVLLASVFVLITFRPGGFTQQLQTARRLVVVWLGQNLFLTVSALWRLHLYVQVYSLTRLRVAAFVWMLLIAAGLAWTALRIVSNRSNQWLVNINFITTLLVLFFCSFVNFSGMIAWYNARHCREISGEGVNIDLAYLEMLGPEALPALEWLAPRIPTVLGQQANTASNVLRAQLKQQVSDWRGWTLRYHVLDERERSGRGYEQNVATNRRSAAVPAAF